MWKAVRPEAIDERVGATTGPSSRRADGARSAARRSAPRPVDRSAHGAGRREGADRTYGGLTDAVRFGKPTVSPKFIRTSGRGWHRACSTPVVIHVSAFTLAER